MCDVFAAKSADAQQFHLKDQTRVWRNRAGVAVAAVGEFRRDRQLHLVADLHGGDTKIPAADDLARAKDKSKRLVTIHGAVELFAVGERAGVMDGHEIALFRDRASASG